MINARLSFLGLFLALIFTISCNDQRREQNKTHTNDERAIEVLDKSVSKHGGWSLYDSLTTLSYTKRILLYDSIGQLESDQIQYHRYNVSPELSGDITWIEDQDTVKIILVNETAKKLVNGKEVLGESQYALQTFMSGYYVTFQPPKLYDNPDQLVYEGTDTLKNDQPVYVLQPKDTTANADQWWYYFNTNDYQLVACLVKHDDRYSFIENLAYDSTTGLTFNKNRKSYFVDSKINIKYLRAEYYYDDYKAQFKN